jgi:hypothetical protein
MRLKHRLYVLRGDEIHHLWCIPQAKPLAFRLRSLPTRSHAFSLILPSLVTAGGSLSIVVFVNMLRSGRSSSFGGGGLGGALAYRVGIRISGSSISSVACNELRDAAGDVGVDIDLWIE